MSGLEAFRDPASIAVVGASDDPGKWGYWLATGALRGRERRPAYLVNRRARTVRGEPAFSSVDELPEPAELVAICVPGPQVCDVVDASLARGSRAFLTISSGVTEPSRLASLLDRHHARMIGPNSLGLYDSSSQLELAWGHFGPGRLAIVSQSGQLGVEIATLGSRVGIGVSRFVSIGNQLDITAVEILDDLLDHPQTALVALYLESFSHGAALVRTLRRLALAGKPTILLATGASEGSRRLALSHTGSLTSPADVLDAACRVAGAIRVSTPTELVHVARLLARGGSPRGRRVAIVSDSGGQGGVAADAAAARGLCVPELSDTLQADLAGWLPSGASTANPVDLAGAGEADLHTYAAVTERLIHSGEADAVVVSGYLGRYGEDVPSCAAGELEVVDRLGAIASAHGPPLVIHSMSVGSAAVARMEAHDLPVYPGIEFAMDAIARAAELNERPGRDLPGPGTVGEAVVEGYWGARGLLSELGLPVPNARLVTSAQSLDDCTTLAFPVVLKAGWLAHKSEQNGIRLGLESPAALSRAYDEMRAELGDSEYVVEEQDRRAHVVEMLVGARRDRDFGPVVVVGAGGTETELTRDISVELAPVDLHIAHSMIDRLRCRPILSGWRGRPGVDIDALASIVVTVSAAIVERTALAELEINPVLVGEAGALPVDALVVPRPPLIIVK